MTDARRAPTGMLAFESLGVRLPLQVLRSAAGHYIGTFDDEGPVSRESAEYWATEAEAERAMAAGEGSGWTQRDHN
jgi:hypothetical protein